MSFEGKTVLITGASRGIGLAVAKKLGSLKANVALLAKTVTPHPTLPGTIFTAAKEVEEAGGKALPLECDIRFEDQVISAIQKVVQKFGGIDIVINNASAINLTNTQTTTLKKFDLMHQVNTRGTWLVSKHSLPYLKKSSSGQILNMSPPLAMEPVWFNRTCAYTMAKYGMSMCVLGMSEEFKNDKIKVNALWPYTTIYTDALKMIDGANDAKKARKPEIMADAAILVLSSKDPNFTGKFLIDEIVLRENGVQDMTQYDVVKGDFKKDLDGFLTKEIHEKIQSLRNLAKSKL